MSATVFLASEQVQSGLMRLDVLIKDAPGDLFGAAFHLRVKGDGWDLLRWELGDIFPLSVQPLTLVSVQKDTAEIIAGLSLKRGHKAVVKDGKLLSLYLHTKNAESLTFSFTDKVLSTFQVQRVDHIDVVWIDSTFSLPRDLHTNVLHHGKSFSLEDVTPLSSVYILLFGVLFLTLLLIFLYLLYAKNKKCR